MMANNSTKMTQYGFNEGFSLADGAFSQRALALPQPEANDLLVKIQAFSINPVDTKLRQSLTGPQFHVLGYDAIGTVSAIGKNVTDFNLGDKVYYAGTMKRDGSYATYQLVDHRLVSRAPQKLTAAESAAVPLTGITAWELLFEQMGFGKSLNDPQIQAKIEQGANTATDLSFPDNQGKQLLIINGAGGVGTMLSQLAHWAGFKVAATASPKHFDWLRQNQVDLCLDYHQDLAEQIKAAHWGKFDGIAVLITPDDYFDLIAEQIVPFGQVGCIVETDTPLPIGKLKNLNVSWDWEFMFAKSNFNYQVATQGQILKQLAHLLDQGKIHSTLTKTISGLNPTNLAAAHQLIESGHTEGKVVLTV
ncbi:zinc-binding alcohol dehydrogenase family protein [Lapidilactobacillus wuchangensis]|uniref:zinc-binding alcohol dehydrogenase family protein n=1 Tax=Lapidilactobacillus wuchangensis TaxID=2486001 RepID=UPI001CDBCFC4|nr:zinc-binding alcohol dehydrogenase family protein [Lapidilactobacillus wuchangensis]